MVVGMRVTKRATRTGTPRSVPEYLARPTNVTTAMRKMMVRPARRMSRAISLGVLRRSAPSTRAIMRSMKVEPGSAVMRMTSQSETTMVPPVTALRSPPASRMTGADSPVMALSLTLATPSTISPSEGTRSPASTRTKAPFRRSGAGVSVQRARSSGRASSLAMVSLRARRRLSARARPRPSATASAKVANRTVSQSQMAMATGKAAGWWVARLRTARMVTRIETISVTKMTGLRMSFEGVELDEGVAGGPGEDLSVEEGDVFGCLGHFQCVLEGAWVRVAGSSPAMTVAGGIRRSSPRP